MHCIPGVFFYVYFLFIYSDVPRLRLAWQWLTERERQAVPFYFSSSYLIAIREYVIKLKNKEIQGPGDGKAIKAMIKWWKSMQEAARSRNRVIRFPQKLESINSYYLRKKGLVD